MEDRARVQAHRLSPADEQTSRDGPELTSPRAPHATGASVRTYSGPVSMELPQFDGHLSGVNQAM
jgi:hypothetical protein